MSFNSGKWAHSIRIGSPKARHVLLQLVSHKNQKNGLCFPSHECLAEETGYSVRTIGRAIKELVNLDLVKQSNRFTEDGKQTSNSYTFNHTGGDTVTTLGNVRSDKNDTVRVTNMTVRGDTVTDKQRSNKEINKKVTQTNIKSKKTPVPDTLTFTESHKKIASEKGLDIENELEKFINYNKKKGSIINNWDATFDLWLLKATDFKPNTQTTIKQAMTAAHKPYQPDEESEEEKRINNEKGVSQLAIYQQIAEERKAKSKVIITNDNKNAYESQ